VTLGIGWDETVDLWSVGCILAELWTGALLFSTHDEVEHLALMERVLGTLPQKMLHAATMRKADKNIRHGALRWPERARDRHSEEYVRSQPRLRDVLSGESGDDAERGFEPLPWTPQLGHFYDLVRGLLEFHPHHRMPAADALHHSFVKPAAGGGGERVTPAARYSTSSSRDRE